MNKLGQKVHELRIRKGLTLRQLGDLIGKTAAYLSIIENGHRIPPRRTLKQIAEALDVTLEYFAGDRPEPDRLQILMDLQELVERHSGAVKEEERTARRVPILSDIAAGDPVSRSDPFPPGVAHEYIEVPADIKDPHAFGLRIKGDSMEPRLYEGDIVIVCPSWRVRESKPVVAKVRDDEITCKLFSHHDEMIVLTPLNPKYPPQLYTKKQMVWVYPVARVISNIYG
jgi:repressor LexA